MPQRDFEKKIKAPKRPVEEEEDIRPRRTRDYLDELDEDEGQERSTWDELED